MRLTITSPNDLTRGLGRRIKARRLARNLMQADLAAHAGVSLPSLKRLENGGQGSIEMVARLALILGEEDRFEELFTSTAPATLDEVIEPPTRLRASGRSAPGGK